MRAKARAVAGAVGLPPRVLTGFVDMDVNRLLGLDTAREAALELVALGPETAPAPPLGAHAAIEHPTLPLSSSEVDYPLLHEIHAASSLDSPDAVRAWRLGAGSRGGGAPAATVGSDPDYTGRGRGPTAPTPSAQLPAGRSAESSANVARRIEQDTSVVALPAPRALSGRGLGETIHRRGS